MTALLDWARQRPPGSERWVLEELDALQAGGPVGGDRKGEREAALEILVRRGLVSAQTAAAVRLASVGASAGVLPAAAPRTPEPLGVRASDPGAVIGPVVVALAPFPLLMPLLGLVDLGAAMWLATGGLVTGLLVLLLSGGRGSTTPRGGRGRLSSRAMLVVAVLGLATPSATLLAAVDAGRSVPEFFGACLGYQGMAAFFLFGAAVIVRRQERGAR